ncbi:MAG: MerR family transcriptional regulator [Syntrophobacterales bacterium]|nr:MAG: MerR family transcriptional regulator [Syntrophobacterales bacterium]
MVNRQLYKIGQVSKKAHVTLRTIRYYEELGLIEPTKRTKGGFRLYTEESIERLRFIQGLKLLDFPLSKISEMFKIRERAQSGDEASHRVMRLLQSQHREASKRKGQYEKLIQEIRATMELVRECYGCEIKPSYEACRPCGIISHKGALPLIIRAIL